MALPIQASLTGGSSSAKSDTTLGTTGGAGGGGTRGALVNVATGQSRLSSAAGNSSMDWQTMALIGGGAALVLYAMSKKRR